MTAELQMQKRLAVYQLTAIFSILFAVVGFSYNVWRMEVSERNNNIRTASFEMLTELAALEQLVYSAAYDDDLKEGSPRKGWVKVGVIRDLSILTTKPVEKQAAALVTIWSEHWSSMASNKISTDAIVRAIDAVRSEIRNTLNALE